MTSKTLSRLNDANDILSDNGLAINEHKTVDFIAGLYEKLGTLKKRVRATRRKAKNELLDRAEKYPDAENDKGQPILQDDHYSAKAYASGHTEIDEEAVKEALIEHGKNTSAEEAVKKALEICGGPNVGATKTAVKEGVVPDDAVNKVDASEEDHKNDPSRVSVKEGGYEDALPAV